MSSLTVAVDVLGTAPATITLELGTPGPEGLPGTAATIAAGTTTTLSPGSSATVTNVGTSSAAVFNFGIPAGQTGATGSTGATGTAATIAVGSTSTGAAGSSASVANSGTSSAAVFDFTIPRGDVGATGATGATGAVGPGVAVGGTTGQFLQKSSGTDYQTNWATIIPGDRYLTTSTTSLTINNADKTLTIGTGLSYSPQQDLVISETSNPTNRHMHARVTSYNSGTGVLVVNVISHTGSGTYSSWVVNVGGATPAASTSWGAITGTLSSQVDLQGALDLKSNLASPTFTGVPAAPTATAGTSTTQLATTAFVTTAANLKANISSPTFTGVPAAPTATAGTNTTQLATTAFVTNGLSSKANTASPTFTGTVTIPAGASISGYLTTSSAASTYQTLSGMSSYLTTSAAASTYQTLSGMSSYLTTSAAASTYYPLSNPSGFITSSALTGYATESWVTSQGYLTDAPSDGNEYVRKNAAWAIATGGGGGAVWGGITGVVTDQTDLVTYVTGLGYQTASDVSTYVTGLGYLTDAPSDSQQYVRYNGGWSVNAGFTFGDSPTDGNYYVRMGATGWVQIGNGTDIIATQIWVGSQNYITDAPIDGTPYARQNAGWVSVSTTALAANQLTNGVVTTNPTSGPTASGDVLQYNGTDLVWAAGGGGGGLTISTLSNGATSTLDATAPTSGQALSYNGADLIWATPVAAGPSVSSTVSSSYSTHTLVSGDANNFVHIDQASYVYVDIPEDSTYSFPIGTIVRIAVENASYLTVRPANSGIGPNINGANNNQPLFLTSSGSQVINCVKVAADRWVVS